MATVLFHIHVFEEAGQKLSQKINILKILYMNKKEEYIGLLLLTFPT